MDTINIDKILNRCTIKDKIKEIPLWIHNNFGLDIPDGTYIH